MKKGPGPPHTLDGILGPGGALCRAVAGFEPRPGQQAMARHVAEALEKGVPALIEAGTGTGKTFGYLVPLLLCNRKAVISTATKQLQEQIATKDLPLLLRATGLTCDALVMKGRRNYLCVFRTQQYFARSSPGEERDRVREKIEAWMRGTAFADRSELPWLTDDDPLWDHLSASSEECLGSLCPDLDRCFLMRLRIRAARAGLVIVNHHLFFSDLRVKQGGVGEIIPRFEALVFDEAHHVEEIATTYLGESVATHQLLDWARDLERTLKKPTKKARRLLKAFREGVEGLGRAMEGVEDRGRLTPEAVEGLRRGPGEEILEAMTALCRDPGVARSDNPAIEVLRDKGVEYQASLTRLWAPAQGPFVHWFERRHKGLTLHASPLSVSGPLSEHLYRKVRALVFTSATLSTQGTFAYLRERLGIPLDALEAVCPSPFVFETQSILYVPRDLPPPQDARFGREAAQRIREILLRTRGRALVLFTSHHNLNLVAQVLQGTLPYRIFRQGEAPRTHLLAAFKGDLHSVLLATGSFWEGIDVPGEALSCLIVDKLPFDSPGDPMVAARIEAIRAAGGNPFIGYQVPSATIALRQGLGRLIRNRTDRGVLAVLDVRLLLARYGRLFLDSLPRIPLTEDMEDITAFFATPPPGGAP